MLCTLDFQSVEPLCSNFHNVLPDCCNIPDKVLNLRHLYKVSNFHEKYLEHFVCTMLGIRLPAAHIRLVASGEAPPVFGRTFNPISTRGADYAHHSTIGPPPDFQTLRRPWIEWIHFLSPMSQTDPVLHTLHYALVWLKFIDKLLAFLRLFQKIQFRTHKLAPR